MWLKVMILIFLVWLLTGLFLYYSKKVRKSSV